MDPRRQPIKSWPVWAALSISVFLAAYTPTAVHFMIGQAMFTLLVVVLFHLIQLQGWRTGLVRVEDILVGAGTAVIVGTIFWPRGAHGQLRASLASLLEAGGAYFAVAVPADVELDHVIAFARTAEWIGRVSHALGGLAAPLAQVQAIAARRWWQ